LSSLERGREKKFLPKEYPRGGGKERERGRDFSLSIGVCFRFPKVSIYRKPKALRESLNIFNYK
ncbi:hypothetical protein, partial [Kitasatospora cathayae]|uniref:hypothetical protein n=1 Tax=Kitasatospora cathayae TaxID=3004092 RepID=UPI0022DCFCC4